MLQEDIPSLGLDDVLLPLQTPLYILVTLEQHLQLLLACALQLHLPPFHPLPHCHELRAVPLQNCRLLFGVLLCAVARDLLKLHRLHLVGLQLHFVGVRVVLGLGQSVLDLPEIEQLFGELVPVGDTAGDLCMELGKLHAVPLQHSSLTVQLVLLKLVDFLIPHVVEVLELEHVRLLQPPPLVLLLLGQRADVPVLLFQAQLRQHMVDKLGFLVRPAILADAAVLREDLDVLVQGDVNSHSDRCDLLQHPPGKDLLLLIVYVCESICWA
mmetsp:Transcript_75273/g.126671  ORF Transcript_75273/g.126671 Transcript_75273/m.126671 type:complete len:269 (-) Transcript_75273:181-987(-)